MLNGRISVEEEGEVEEELAALEAEAAGPRSVEDLPAAPITQPKIKEDGEGEPNSRSTQQRHPEREALLAT
jgi:charged multivesicular body protein 6